MVNPNAGQKAAVNGPAPAAQAAAQKKKGEAVPRPACPKRRSRRRLPLLAPAPVAAAAAFRLRCRSVFYCLRAQMRLDGLALVRPFPDDRGARPTSIR